MTSSTLLRAAAVVALLQFAGHGLLFVRARPTHGDAEASVVTTMKAHRFNFGGSTRSYWDMYFGYGLEAAFVCLVEAIVFWQLATIAATAPAMVRPMVALFLAANVAHAILVTRYFFLAPLVPDVLIAVLLAWVLQSSAFQRERPPFSTSTAVAPQPRPADDPMLRSPAPGRSSR